MKKVAVIGSNSFSGGDFIDLLLTATDYEVLGISRSAEKSPLFLAYRKNPGVGRFSFFQMDLNRDMENLQGLLKKQKPAFVVNFAAQSEVAPSWDHPEQWFQTNAVALAALANFLCRQDWLERYVHISSPEVYGTCEGRVTEQAPLNPSTPYAASKAAGDLMLQTLFRQYGFPIVIIRSTNVYGPGQQLFKIIPRSVIFLKAGRTIALHGGGKAVKSYIHIRDVSLGELAAMEQAPGHGQIYHLSPDAGVSVRHVVEKICHITGNAFAASVQDVDERPGQDKAYVIDSSRARQQLGWRPGVDLAAGLTEVVGWVTDNWDEIRHHGWDYVHKP